MDARKDTWSLRELIALAYRKPEAVAPRRVRAPGIPGPLYDVTLVTLLLALAAAYFL